jgi:predicted glycosyl hydrolase (DUF1957 family)
MSGGVSYNDDMTLDANAFASQFLQSYLNHEKCAEERPQIHLLASDGELYGHHKPWRDRFLSHLLQKSAPAYGFEVCSLERYLQHFPPTREIELHIPSSWSCSHGVSRWESGCGCTNGDSSWKKTLRAALNNLAERGNQLFEQFASKTLANPWAARDGYLPLRNGWISAEQFCTTFGKPQDRSR